MAPPARRRPGAASPLAPRVEDVLTPATQPVPSPQELTPETAAPAPARPDRAPATPVVEQPEQDHPDSEPGEADRHRAEHTALLERREQDHQTAENAAAQEEAARVPLAVSDYLQGPKGTTSFGLHTDLKARAERAVLDTAGKPGGARSFAALANEAIARELIRLADEFNDGVPFEPNQSGSFRMGRPFGS